MVFLGDLTSMCSRSTHTYPACHSMHTCLILRIRVLILRIRTQRVYVCVLILRRMLYVCILCMCVLILRIYTTMCVSSYTHTTMCASSYCAYWYICVLILRIWTCVPSRSIRQHTSAYVSIRQHTSHTAHMNLRAIVRIRQHMSAYVSIREHTSLRISTCVPSRTSNSSTRRRSCKLQHTSAYVSIRQPKLLVYEALSY